MSIRERLKDIQATLPESVTLVAVSKTKPVAAIMEAYNAGQRIFGENRVQEMVEKEEELPKDIEWHMIGHVQRNKVKHMAQFVSLIHGIDDLNLLKEVNKQAKRHHRTIDCLLQIKIADEDSKFGMTTQEAKNILQSEELSKFKNVRIVGVMGMATFTDDKKQIEQEFKKLKSTFENLNTVASGKSELTTVSMGMSGDYPIAVACGSTMVRVGSSIFGERNYADTQS